MSASSEELGLKLLLALNAEKERSTSLLDCRTLSAIQTDLNLTNAEINQAIRFLLSQRLIQSVDRSDGKAVLPSTEGLAALASHEKAIKDEKKSKLQARQKWYAIIISLLGLLAYFASKYWPR
jgi:hypothetical protein